MKCDNWLHVIDHRVDNTGPIIQANSLLNKFRNPKTKYIIIQKWKGYGPLNNLDPL